MFGHIKGQLARLKSAAQWYMATAGIPIRQRELIKSIRAKKLTYLSDTKLASIIKTCGQIEEQGIEGLFLEAGCALGGSAILIASIKRQQRPLRIYDVFDMIPPPTQEDTQDVVERYEAIRQGKSVGIDGDTYYGYIDNLYDVVQKNLTDFSIDCVENKVSLIKGLVQDTLIVDQPVAFAHIDVDWYEPVITCLERIFPALVVGGSIILDDYEDWSGCRKATDEYLQRVAGQYSLDHSAGSLKLSRIAT